MSDEQKLKRGEAWKAAFKKRKFVSPAQLQLAHAFPDVNLILINGKLFVYEIGGRVPRFTFKRTESGHWVSGTERFRTPGLAVRWASAVMVLARGSSETSQLVAPLDDCVASLPADR